MNLIRFKVNNKFKKELLTTISILLIATASYAQNYVVERVLDGDTIAVITPIGTFEKVRMIGILTPKSNSNDEDEGDEDDATLFVKGLIKPGQYIRLRFENQERDRDGRLLAYVYSLLGSTKDFATPMRLPEYYEISLEQKKFNIHGYYFNFLNATIIKAGYAVPMPTPPNVKYADLFKELYEEAREAGRGLWGVVENTESESSQENKRGLWR